MAKLQKTSIFILFLTVFASLASATYTDYIGAGHDAGVTVTTCSSDETAAAVVTRRET